MSSHRRSHWLAMLSWMARDIHRCIRSRSSRRSWSRHHRSDSRAAANVASRARRRRAPSARLHERGQAVGGASRSGGHRRTVRHNRTGPGLREAAPLTTRPAARGLGSSGRGRRDSRAARLRRRPAQRLGRSCGWPHTALELGCGRGAPSTGSRCQSARCTGVRTSTCSAPASSLAGDAHFSAPLHGICAKASFACPSTAFGEPPPPAGVLLTTLEPSMLRR